MISLILQFINIWGCSSAPGAPPLPGRSQIGKLELPDRGGSFRDRFFFEHNVYFQDQDRTKLNLKPGTNRALIISLPNYILRFLYSQILFNIIQIIEQTSTKEYLVWSYQHSIHIISFPEFGIRSISRYFPDLGRNRFADYLCNTCAIAHIGQERFSPAYRSEF